MQQEVGIEKAMVTLSSAQLKSLNASPVQIATAPGGQKVLFPIAAFFQYKFGTVPYTIPGGGDGVVWITPAGVNPQSEGWGGTSCVGVLDQSRSVIDVPLLSLGRATQSDFANQPLFVTFRDDANDSGELSAGDGTLIVTAFFSIVALS